MQYLNLGCGNRFDPSWTNLNFTSTGEGVISHDLTQGIPFPDESFDVVYHSHVLEHFPKAEAEPFIQECYRVLRPQGILRVVVPDLEQIAKIYLESLEQAITGSQEWGNNYDWILLEMYDQTVRNESGGEMMAYLFREYIPNGEFVIQRQGVEGKKLIESGHQHRQHLKSESYSQSQRVPFIKKFYRFLRYPSYRQETLLKLVLGQEYKALQIGRFRQSGEVHQWMYDRYSLSLLLKKCGFQNILQQTAATSYIPNWTCFNLDTEPDGSVYKPDSMFLEAIKPSV